MEPSSVVKLFENHPLDQALLPEPWFMAITWVFWLLVVLSLINLLVDFLRQEPPGVPSQSSAPTKDTTPLGEPDRKESDRLSEEDKDGFVFLGALLGLGLWPLVARELLREEEAPRESGTDNESDHG